MPRRNYNYYNKPFTNFPDEVEVQRRKDRYSRRDKWFDIIMITVAAAFPLWIIIRAIV